jgi:hypothetical protein
MFESARLADFHYFVLALKTREDFTSVDPFYFKNKMGGLQGAMKAFESFVFLDVSVVES